MKFLSRVFFYLTVLCFFPFVSAQEIVLIPDGDNKLPTLYDEDTGTINIYHKNCSAEAIKNKAFGCENPIMTNPAQEACRRFPEQMKDLCSGIDFAAVSQQEQQQPPLPREEAFSEQDEDNTTLPPLPDMDETEAGGACNTPACLQTEEATDQTASVMMQMCREALPEHCQQVLPQFTACTPTDDMSWGQISLLSSGSCITGLWDGVVDTAFFFGGMAKGLGTTLWRSLRSSEHWEETKDMGSFLMEDLQSTSREDLKGMFDKGFWNEADKFINCLNTRGRYEYLCEGASQVLAGGVGAYGVTRGVGFLGKKAMNVPRRARWMAQGGRGKLPILNRKERRAQIAKLKEMLAQQDEMDVTKLSPFMLNRLTKRQFQSRVDFSKLTDDQAMHLSRRRLSQIHPTEYAKMDITKLQQTINRMPDEGFKALMTGNSASQIPVASVARNLYRIPSDQISNIKNIHKVRPRVFRRSMSSERLKGLSYAQAMNVKNGPQYRSLASGQKKIVDDVIKSDTKKTEHLEQVNRNKALNKRADEIEESNRVMAEAPATPSALRQPKKPRKPAAQTDGRKFLDEPTGYKAAKARADDLKKQADAASDEWLNSLSAKASPDEVAKLRTKTKMLEKHAADAQRQVDKILDDAYGASRIPAKIGKTAKQAGRGAGSQSGNN